MRFLPTPKLMATAILAGGLVLQAPLAAEAGPREGGGIKTHVVTLKTLSCGAGKVMLGVSTSTVIDSDFLGNGTYYLRTQIRWQRQTSNGWTTEDNRVGYSNKRGVANGAQGPLQSSLADDTTWGKTTFAKGTWRARFIVTVLEVSGGPDEAVDSAAVNLPAQRWTTQC